MGRLFDFLDSRTVIRRIVLFFTMYMTWEAFQWATLFAESVSNSGLDIAATIGAVTAPVTLLQGYVFKVYAEGRNK